VDCGASRIGFFAYSANYLIDVDNAIIVDVEATTAIRQAEVTAAKRMVERSLAGFDLYPAKLIGDTAYGTAEMLNWLVNEHGIEPHIPVFDKSQHVDGTLSRDDFAYDHKRDFYICPAGKELRQRQKIYRVPRPLVDRNGMMRYRASKLDCQNCALKPKCCPNTPARKIPRPIHEGARDMACNIGKTEACRTSRCQRKKVEMLFAHLKRILKLDRLRLRGPNGPGDEFRLAATAQNLRKLAKLIPMPSPIAAT
jgi:Transposase DDE domain